ncbi:DNA-binding protein [Patescibacteria group bacterium]|nr:DNA-binding protein [Patescibacteria group bacterium]MBU1885785.1 DNA-binding protein [Patescibacteria group bacterium]
MTKQINSRLQKFSNFVLFKTKTGKVNVDVLFHNETLWLTQKLLAQLFEVKVPAISKHLKNIFATKELQKKAVVSIMEITASNNKTYKTKQ